jgi:hypothetical protein
MSPQCSRPGCDKALHSHGLCGMHSQRLRRRGDPDAAPRRDADPLPRFWASVKKTEDCWIWTGRISEHGYGLFNTGRRSLGENRRHYAHRYSYELLVGPIPEGLTLDHLCHTQDDACADADNCLHRRCCNPAHLEPVTSAVNTRRGSAARKTHCKYKHELTAANTYRQSATGRRSCIECRKLRALGITAAMHAELLTAEEGHAVAIVAYPGLRRVRREVAA